MNRRRLSKVVLGLIFVAIFASAQTAMALAAPIVRYVAPGGACGGAAPCYATIQAAVDAAGSDDIIRVAAGTYTGVQQVGALKQMVYLNKTVIIRGAYTVGEWTVSRPHETPTILNAQGQGRVFYISGSVSPRLEGLRITGGDATGLGGGQWPYGGAGGGIYVDTAAASIRDCVIIHNTATRSGWGGGGGVYLLHSAASLTGNFIYGNVASTETSGDWGEGGGVCIANSAASLTGNRILRNIGTESDYTGMGGGIYVEGSDIVQLRNNIVAWNVGSVRGRGTGGGIFVGLFSHAQFVNTVVADNFSGVTTTGQHDDISRGAGIAVEMSSPIFLQTTIVRNTGGDGSGVYLFNSASDVTFENTILTHHTVGIYAPAGGSATVKGVLFYGNPGGNVTGGGSVTVSNSVSGDPAFAADGFHITAASAAKDKGTNAGGGADIDGHARPRDAAHDFGADEYKPWIRLHLPVDVSTAPR